MSQKVNDNTAKIEAVDIISDVVDQIVDQIFEFRKRSYKI